MVLKDGSVNPNLTNNSVQLPDQLSVAASVFKTASIGSNLQLCPLIFWAVSQILQTRPIQKASDNQCSLSDKLHFKRQTREKRVENEKSHEEPLSLKIFFIP